MSQAPKSMGPIFPLSLVNRLGDPARKQLLRVDPERVMKVAQRLTGLSDYGDSDGALVDPLRDRIAEEPTAQLGEHDWSTQLRWTQANRTIPPYDPLDPFATPPPPINEAFTFQSFGRSQQTPMQGRTA